MRSPTPTRRLRRPRRTRRPLRLWFRSPVAYWTVAVALSAVTVSSIESRRTALDARAARLGPTVAVAVVIGDHRGGERLAPGDVELREVPRSMVSDDALSRTPGDDRLLTPVRAGEVLTAGRFASGHPSALAATVPAGWRAVAVPRPAGGLPLTPGDRVDLIALTPSGTSSAIARDAVVLRADEDAWTIAVPGDDVGTVADAVLASTLTVVLAGPG